VTDFYVYAYARQDGTLYYIGKGSGKRAFAPHKKNIAVPQDRSRIVFMERHLTEIGALALERRYIRWYGKKTVGTGVLRNLTDGGEGNAGRTPTAEQRQKQSAAMKLSAWWRGCQLSDKTKQKISATKIGAKLTEQHKNNIRLGMLNKPCSEETKAKLSQASKGISRRGTGFKLSDVTKDRMSKAKQGVGFGVPMPEATKIKIGLAHKGRIQAKSTCPHCQTIGGNTGMTRWHFNNCKQRKGTENEQ
jgi:hypothetical protein